MDNRREFLKKAALLSGTAGAAAIFPPAIQKALAINPDPGSNWHDAEHIVFLMQENRSFDHCYGALQGVRGFNDPRAIQLPDNDPVWLQKNAKGHTHPPFRLDIKNTRATWMGDLPHSWDDQQQARNNGRYDQWLEAKKIGGRNDKDFPMTMGFYSREDIPFYYALADAFTVCDQHFCSALTGTTANRLYFWTGKIREDHNAKARTLNSDTDYSNEASWTTFPERLEEQGISWKIYQNEISVGAGLSDEEDSWLGNFTDNPIEWFSQYHVKLSAGYINFLQQAPAKIEASIHELQRKLDASTNARKNNAKNKEADTSKKTSNNLSADALRKEIEERKKSLARINEDRKRYTRERYEQLSRREKNLHDKAFTTNRNDPFFHQLTSLKYEEAGKEVELSIPRGDILHQFRQDVKNKQLPTVSWLVAPQKFSDHPSAPWYGAWYVSEVMDILTADPALWKKTIFILTYDENDGYFDHIPPFVAPLPSQPATGSVSFGIDPISEVSDNQPLGLGFRVPMVIVSPWTRGGWVNSEVFDHTSNLQFLEKFLQKKFGKSIIENNISSWRRTVCGDLLSAFRPYNGESLSLPEPVKKEPFLQSIHHTRNKSLPPYGKDGRFISLQEKGTRNSCALPYQLYADGRLSGDEKPSAIGNQTPGNKSFELSFAASTECFGDLSRGAAFIVYARTHKDYCRNYALSAGSQLTDRWLLDEFPRNEYRFDVYGPNGFFRMFSGNENDPELSIVLEYERESGKPKQLTGNLLLSLLNFGSTKLIVEIEDNSYGAAKRTIALNASQASKSAQISKLNSPTINTEVQPISENNSSQQPNPQQSNPQQSNPPQSNPPQSNSPQSKSVERIVLNSSSGWYDLSITVSGYKNFEKRYAGRVETGRHGLSDPLMGGVAKIRD